MSFENPTPLFVGARGTLHGWTTSVVGRVVLGVEIDGERYYWNEYHLVDSAGHSGTLVFEEGEDGPEWKLFRLLVPPQPLSVDEAARKRVGDRVSFGGPAIPITLVDRSRVYFIEGRAPEGVEVGDLADFFNADAGDHMIVASWTGHEIEFYEGRDVPAATVAQAFGIALAKPAATRADADDSPTSSFFRRGEEENAGATGTGTAKRFVNGVLTALAAFVVFSWNSCSISCGSSDQVFDSTPRKQPASTVRLAPGSSGTLGSQAYTLGSHTLVEVGRTNGRFERREYTLGGMRDSALLVNGLTGGRQQWHLLRPVPPARPFDGFDAATQRKGSQVNLAGVTMTVTELFLSEPREVNGETSPAAHPVGRQYGFIATSGGVWWLARWDEQQFSLLRGQPVDEKDVLAAFGAGAKP